MLPTDDVPGQVNFGSHADRVVRLIVALVNVLTPGLAGGRLAVELTPGARRTRAGAVVGLPVTDAEAEGLVHLAGRLRPVFAAAERRDEREAAQLVNDMLGEYRP